jgi:membrane protease YdiL (CAAX protease family)
MIKRLTKLEAAPPWGLGSALMAYLAALTAALIGFTLGSILLQSAEIAGFYLGYVLGCVVILLYVYTTRRRPDEIGALRLIASPVPLPIVMLLAVGLAMAIDLLSLVVQGQDRWWPAGEMLLLFNITPDLGVIPLRVGLGAWALAFVFMLILQPIAYELIFRGIMYPALRTALGAWAGLLMSALFAALFHLVFFARGEPNAIALWYLLIVPLLINLCLGAVRAYTGSTIAAMVAHTGFGLFGFLKALALTG